jgi:hypothetical protein
VTSDLGYFGHALCAEQSEKLEQKSEKRGMLSNNDRVIDVVQMFMRYDSK